MWCSKEVQRYITIPLCVTSGLLISVFDVLLIDKRLI